MNRRFFVYGSITIALLVAGLCMPLLASSGYAAAPSEPTSGPTVYTVTTTSGDVLTAGCGSSGTCSLRGAIQLANTAAITPVYVYFAPALNSQTVNLSSTAVITGGATHVVGRGVEITFIKAPVNQPAFQIASNANALNDLSVYGPSSGQPAQDGIDILSGSGNFLSNLTLYGLGGNGITIESGASSNTIVSTRIGVRTSGGALDTSCALGNFTRGIVINGANNVLSGNIIGCNHYPGVAVSGAGATGNSLVGNLVGVAPDGTAIPNIGVGIGISDGASNNRIGKANLTPNVVSGNGVGIYIGDAGTSGNSVQNNYVGVSPTGTFAVANQLAGVWIIGGADSNQIGGRILTESNTIAGNSGPGILIAGIGAFDATDTRQNLVEGNWIGLQNAPAAKAPMPIPNSGPGILLSDGAWFNGIGQDDDDYRNVIAGNAGDGVAIRNARLNFVVGNLFSVQTGLFTSFANDQNGIRLDESAALNSITRNQISRSGANGIVISGTATATNSLTANDTIANTLSGIQIQHGAHANTVISGLVSSNYAAGIHFDSNGTSGNLITATTVIYNAAAGISEGGGASGNVWSHISTFSNGGLGIDQDPQPGPSGIYPRVTSVTALAGVVTVKGKGSPSLAQAYKVELYQVAVDASGFGEGKVFLGEDTTDLNGNWTIVFGGPAGCYTAFQTVTGPLVGIGASSEFGPNSCRTFLPVVSR